MPAAVVQHVQTAEVTEPGEGGANPGLVVEVSVIAEAEGGGIGPEGCSGGDVQGVRGESPARRRWSRGRTPQLGHLRETAFPRGYQAYPHFLQMFGGLFVLRRAMWNH